MPNWALRPFAMVVVELLQLSLKEFSYPIQPIDAIWNLPFEHCPD
jgi:hypothetical protein